MVQWKVKKKKKWRKQKIVGDTRTRTRNFELGSQVSYRYTKTFSMHCEKFGQYYFNTLPTVVPIVNPTIYWAIFCPVVLVNVSTLLHTCIILLYFDQNLGKDMTLQLPDYGSPLVGKILTNCWAKFEKICLIDGWVDYWQSVGKCCPTFSQCGDYT